MKIDWKKLAVALLGSQLVGLLGAVVTAPAITSGWYASLVKPPFTPAESVFGPMWIFLYCLIGFSLYIVWNLQSKTKKIHTQYKLAHASVVLFALQLALSFSWSVVFFGFQLPFLALFVIGALWLSIAMLMTKSWRVSNLAALLLLPYLAWVSFAAILNFYIVMLN